MRPIALVGPVLFVAGFGLLGLALSRGEASLYLVVVVPVITGSGLLSVSGILLVVAGFFATFVFWPGRRIDLLPEGEVAAGDTTRPESTSPGRWGGVVFLGPLPLVFGSDPRMARAMLLLGFVLFLALLALTVFALLS